MANAERAARLSAIIDAFPSRRVLVVGDLIADEFISVSYTHLTLPTSDLV